MKVITWIKSWNNEQERKWKWLNNMQRNLCSLHVTPNLLLKSTKKFLSGLFLLLFVKPPHSSTMHSIGESLVQKKCALDRCKDFNGLSDSIRPEPSLSTSFLFDEGVQQWGRLYSWGVASSISPSVGEDAGSLMCKAFWLSNTLKGCCHQWICTKLTFFQRLWLKQVSAAGQQRKLKPWTGLQRFTSKRVACFSAPAIQKVDTTMTCIGSTIQPTTASSLKNQHTERKSEATDRFALCTRKQINLDRFGGWGYLDVFGYFLFAYFRIANKLPWNRVVFGRDRRTLDSNRMSDFSVGQRVEYYSRTLRRYKARQVGNMTAKGGPQHVNQFHWSFNCKVGSFISEALPFPNGLNAKSRWSAAWGVN